MSQSPIAEDGKKLRVAALISGRGSNMIALANATADPSFPASISLVVSNDPAAGGLAKAGELGISTLSLPHGPFQGDREAHERSIDTALVEHDIDLVCLAGYMRLLSPWLVNRWHNRMINIHPSLLPSFKGLRTHERAIETGVRWHGCTVHFVRESMDEGPIIAQAVVPVMPGDTADGLGVRVLKVEHQLYPHALNLVASGKVRASGDEVIDTPFDAPSSAANPSL